MLNLFKKHHCPICGKKYRKIEYLMHHQLLVHDNSNAYDCSNCGKTFDDMDLLKSHIRKDHSLKKTSDNK